MTPTTRAGRRRPVLFAAAGAVALATAVVAAASAQATTAPDQGATELYIVAVAGEPLATYEGTVAGLPATKPAPGRKLDTKTKAARDYRAHLRTKRSGVLRGAGIRSDATVYQYDVVFNGFAAKLTAGQVAKLRGTAGVTDIWKNEIVEADTIGTPDFLGLTGSNGVWQQQFGGASRAGEGIIIGVVDSGIWPENPSFAPLPLPRPDQAIIDAKWNGTCQAGTSGPAVTCNNKLLGARYYTAAGTNTNPVEYQSPRDYNGHGSHTSSTAGGNNGVPAVIHGQPVGNVSGMAPAARLAMYKALWHQPSGTSSGGSVDLVAALNDAVEDGVDVINYSISGSQTSFVDSVEIAFLNAADAGVFIATSAGNNGPTISTVAHNSPWVMTVAASSHDRAYNKTATLGNGASYVGVGVGAAVPSSPLIDSVNAGLDGAPAADVELCFIGTLDPAKVAGKIVLCKRGVNARTDKSKAVKDAGGVGMIQYNDPDNSLNADYHHVPSVHVGRTAGLAIKAYAATPGATASLSASVQSVARAPEMASFSSRGPARAGNGDLIKPDITAPGVDVIAAVSPSSAFGSNFNTNSGTSMSSPHIAGLAALIRSEHPSWSPMWVKSALMTTAVTTDNTGAPIQRAGANATAHDYGSGHVSAAAAFDPGLVYDSGFDEWVQFLCGTEQLTGAICTSFGSIDPSNLNYPSIGIGDLAGTQTVTRRVTNIANYDVQYQAKVTAPAGTTVTVTPSTLVVPAGATRSFQVQITRTTAALNAYTFGSLTWQEKQIKGKRVHSVTSPIAVRPVALAAPREVSGTGTSGSLVLTNKAGYNGTLNAAVHGLVPATVTTMHLVGTQTNFVSSNPQTGPAVGKVTVNVPAGSQLARFQIVGSDYPMGTDIDLFVYRAGTNQLVGQSATGSSDETVSLTAAGDYDAYVVQFATVGGITEQDVHHYGFVVGAATGNMTATPASQAVTTGANAPVTVNWSGLTAGSRNLGVVVFSNGTTEIGRSIVNVLG